MPRGRMDDTCVPEEIFSSKAVFASILYTHVSVHVFHVSVHVAPKPWWFLAQSIHARYFEEIAACTDTWSACTGTLKKSQRSWKLQSQNVYVPIHGLPCIDTSSTEEAMYRYIQPSTDTFGPLGRTVEKLPCTDTSFMMYRYIISVQISNLKRCIDTSISCTGTSGRRIQNLKSLKNETLSFWS